MVVEYRLTLAGRSSAEEIASRAVTDPDHRPKPSPCGRALVVDLYASGAAPRRRDEPGSADERHHPGMCVLRLEVDRVGDRSLVVLVVACRCKSGRGSCQEAP